jgi:hypothetical protein
MLWGFETLKGGWYKLRNWFSTSHPLCLTFFAFDWSSFDLLARHTVISDIHSKWRTWFDFDNGYWPTHLYPVTTPEPTRLENLWNWMTHAVLKTPLLLPDGRLVEFLHSCIFSGYLQTQLLDSCYNMVAILTILSRMGFDITKVAIKVQGDDSIGGLLNLIPEAGFPSFLESFGIYAKLYFGSILNLKKSKLLSTLEHAEVLKYQNSGGLPYRSIFELLALLKHPERSQSLPALMARVIGIAYANCGVHSRVYHICEDIYGYLLSINITPDPKGLPGVLSHLESPDETVTQFPLDRFPTLFDTMKLMTDVSKTDISIHTWNTDHFIGTPN